MSGEEPRRLRREGAGPPVRSGAGTIFREFFLGFVRIHVLLRAAQGPVYGLALLDELRAHGYALGPGTLYPLLHGLEETGCLVRENRLVGGRVRKYYLITPEGARALSDARSKIRVLVGEVLASSATRVQNSSGLTIVERRPVNLIRPEVLHARLVRKVRGRVPVVIDVRGDEEYAAGHIPGAQHIPVHALATRCRELPRRRPQVTYCNMRHRGRSRSIHAATILRESGRQAQALDGGFPAWVAAGYPVDREIA